MHIHFKMTFTFINLADAFIQVIHLKEASNNTKSSSNTKFQTSSRIVQARTGREWNGSDWNLIHTGKEFIL